MNKNKKIKIYALSASIAIMLAVIIYLLSPKIYSARVKIADESRSMDLAIGLNPSVAGSPYNKSFDDPNIYHQILSSDDFIHGLEKIKLNNNEDYYHHLLNGRNANIWDKSEYFLKTKIGGENDKEYVIDKIKENIDHNVNKDIILIRTEDSDPVIAALVADSMQSLLQQKITKYKSDREKINLINAQKEYTKNRREYQDAVNSLNNLADDNIEPTLPSKQTERTQLQKEVSTKFDQLSESVKKYVRAQALAQQDAPAFATLNNATVNNNYDRPSLLVNITVCLTLALLLAFWYVKYNDKKIINNWKLDFGNWFSPWSITLFIWIVIILLVKLEGDKLYPLTKQFYISIALWVPILCIVSFTTYQLLPAQGGIKLNTPIDISESIYNILFIIAIACTPLYAYRVYHIVSQFNMADMMNNIRTLALNDEGAGWLKYTVVINHALFLVSLWRYPKIPLWKLITIYTCNVICSLAIMEKGSLFILVFCTLFALYEKGRIKLRTIAFWGVIIIVFSYFFSVARSSTEASKDDLDFVDFFGIYITSPPVAFSQLGRDLSGQLGANTFEVFYDFMNRLGIGHFVTLTKEQDFVMVPVITNVYTVMQPFYVDFGYGGVAFFAMIYGIICGCLYRSYKNGNATGTCLYTYLVQILILQFYQENIFMSISGLTQLIILVALMTQDKVKFSLKLAYE